MAINLNGSLCGGNTKDKHTASISPGTYSYSLTATGPGRVGLKIREKSFQIEGKKTRTWKTLVEKKSKVRGGTTLTGNFTVVGGGDFTNDATVEFFFTRPLGGKRVDYTLIC